MTTPSLIKLVARFVHADSGQPLNDPSFHVRFFDHDALKDDYLGESVLSSNGVAEIIIHPASFRSGLIGAFFARLAEHRPDVYCTVVDGAGKALYRTSVQWDVDVTRIDETTKRPRPTVDLGTFKYRRGEGLSEADGPVMPLRPPV